MTICLIGDHRDLSLTYVGWLARRREIEVLLLDEEQLGVEWEFGYDPTLGAGRVSQRGATFTFESIRGAVVRFNPQPAMPEGVTLPRDEEVLMIVERRLAIEHLLNVAPFAVANRPNCGRSNGSKPYQMATLAGLGFEVPRWLATNDEAAAKEFVAEHNGRVICKSCSGLRSRVRFVSDELFERMKDGTSPVLLQDWVPGRDVRVHVVSGVAFGTEIVSDGVDYRFDGGAQEYRVCSVPPGVAELCLRVLELEGLIIAGLDFRVTPEGAWYCLESNPVPTFLPYEMMTGQPIGDALLDALIAANRD